MNRYLFLLAWVEDSPSAGGESTGVFEQKDLYPEYLQGNPHVFAVEVQSSNKDIAEKYGMASAFLDGYSGMDSVSTLVEVLGNSKHKNPIMVITAPL